MLVPPGQTNECYSPLTDALDEWTVFGADHAIQERHESFPRGVEVTAACQETRERKVIFSDMFVVLFILRMYVCRADHIKLLILEILLSYMQM